MDTAQTQPAAPAQTTAEPAASLYHQAEAQACGLTPQEFTTILQAVAQKHNANTPLEAFYQTLRLQDLALAQACALGKDPAWQRFLTLYRSPILQAAIAITGSATVGHDLADALYAELFGLATRAGERRSPLAGYSGRGSLLGWLRATLAQRHVDHHRRTHREAPLDDHIDPPAAPPTPQPAPAQLAALTTALTRTLAELSAEDRYLLASYFLDRQTLLVLSRVLRVHEATVSRRLKRLTESLRPALLRHLQAGGLSQRAAEEAFGTDPRDLEINLRPLLQNTQTAPFQALADRSPESGPALP